MKNPEDMTRDELIGAVRAYRRILGITGISRRTCQDPELHEVRPCDCPKPEPKCGECAPFVQEYGRTGLVPACCVDDSEPKPCPSCSGGKP